MQLVTLHDLQRKKKKTSNKPISFAVEETEKLREVRIKQEMKNRKMDVGLYSDKLREFTVQLHNELERILELKPL